MHTNGHATNGHATNGHPFDPAQDGRAERSRTHGHEPVHYALLKDKIKILKQERDAIILAHNYQEGAIQDVADFVGDSLGLAQQAKATDAKVILFCGVHFMAETAAMLCPEKTVLIPDLAAGCSLADMIVPEQVRVWRKRHPDGVVVCYVNTSAAVKAECDYCVTSTNGIKVLEQIPKDKEILFVPDYYLGSYLKAKTGRNIHLWKGYCPAHAAILPEQVDRLREEHPDAEFLMHPECGCTTKQMDLADQVLSTEGMVRYVERSPAKEFIIATETGLLNRLRHQHPEKSFYPASEHATCHHMQRNTLEKAFMSLVKMQHVVRVDPQLAERAVRPIERMLAVV
ncbi:MAG: quinolinate synthase NadA [Candidatus Omnitrophota bacterium]|nr:quinolinate synthase NadA [Candidatus Omnitrophota bacterium]